MDSCLCEYSVNGQWGYFVLVYNRVPLFCTSVVLHTVHLHRSWTTVCVCNDNCISSNHML